jgi:hypothetical protein
MAMLVGLSGCSTKGSRRGPHPAHALLLTRGAVVANSPPPSAASLSIPPSFASIEFARDVGC